MAKHLTMTRILIVMYLIITINVRNLSYSQATSAYNVLSFGAKPDGLTDSTEAFLKAWTSACDSTNNTRSTLIYVPKGRYLLRPLAFRGPCKTPHLTFLIDGTLVAPPDYRTLGAADNWLGFNGVTAISIVGGSLDAGGPALWACKAQSSDCPAGATVAIYHTTVINHNENVMMQGIKVRAAGDSPNTDGIHVQLSTNVTIFNSSIGTGDDCISIDPGTRNLWIERIACGLGHGIGIGSLARELEEEGVKNVTFKQAVFTSTQNGLRIKSWARPSKGFVQGVQFLDALMHNVQNPIVIDQNYCPHNLNCPGQVSGVKISDVVYQGIRGTSATQVAIKFCSARNPCSGITLQDVDLSYQNEAAQSACNNANGKAFGKVLPNSCL